MRLQAGEGSYRPLPAAVQTSGVAISVSVHTSKISSSSLKSIFFTWQLSAVNFVSDVKRVYRKQKRIEAVFLLLAIQVAYALSCSFQSFDAQRMNGMNKISLGFVENSYFPHFNAMPIPCINMQICHLYL